VIGDILQPTHLLFILVIALLVLGPKRLPEVGRSLGRGLRDFRTAMSGEDHEPIESPVAPTAAAETPVQATAPVQPPAPVQGPVEHGG
jgi:sec-independent protein translocase protein TatA